MEDDILEVVQNREFLGAVREGFRPGPNVHLLSELSSYHDCRMREKQLSEQDLLTFESVFSEPLGYYLLKCFLRLDHCADKARFISEVRTYRALSVSARQRLASQIFLRFCDTREIRLFLRSGLDNHSSTIGTGTTPSALAGGGSGFRGSTTLTAKSTVIKTPVPGTPVASIGAALSAIGHHSGSTMIPSPSGIVSSSPAVTAGLSGGSATSVIPAGSAALMATHTTTSAGGGRGSRAGLSRVSSFHSKTNTTTGLSKSGAFSRDLSISEVYSMSLAKHSSARVDRPHTPTMISGSAMVSAASAVSHRRRSQATAEEEERMGGRSASKMNLMDSPLRGESASPLESAAEVNLETVDVLSVPPLLLSKQQSTSQSSAAVAITADDMIPRLKTDKSASTVAHLSSQTTPIVKDFHTTRTPTADGRADSAGDEEGILELGVGYHHGYAGTPAAGASGAASAALFGQHHSNLIYTQSRFINPIGVFGELIEQLRLQIFDLGRCDTDLFDSVYREVMYDLKMDVFPRFCRSNLYRLYVQMKTEQLKYCSVFDLKKTVIDKKRRRVATAERPLKKEDTHDKKDESGIGMVIEADTEHPEVPGSETLVEVPVSTDSSSIVNDDAPVPHGKETVVSESREEISAMGTGSKGRMKEGKDSDDVTVDEKEDDDKGDVKDSPPMRIINIDEFEVLRVLGRGAFGYVNACVRKKSGAMFALKCVDKRRIKATESVKTIMSERNFLAMMDSRFVTGLKYAFIDDTYLYLVMDLMVGGDLKFHLNRDHFFSAQVDKFYAAQVLLGLEHIHQKGIVYRDVKLENVLLDDKGNCRISDLGLAVEMGRDVYSYAGTPGYTAPEVCLQQCYGQLADYFSFGVLVYRFLSGKKPFELSRSRRRRMYAADATGGAGRTARDGRADGAGGHHRARVNDVDKNVIEVEPEYPSDYFDAEARSLLKSLLCKDVGKRLGEKSAAEIKDHPWFDEIDFGKLESGALAPPFVPNQDEINAGSLRHISRPPLDDKYASVKITEEFNESLKQFHYVSPTAMDEEFVTVLRKVNSQGKRLASFAMAGVSHSDGFIPSSDLTREDDRRRRTSAALLSSFGKFDGTLEDALPSAKPPSVPMRLLRKQERLHRMRELSVRKRSAIASAAAAAHHHHSSDKLAGSTSGVNSSGGAGVSSAAGWLGSGMHHRSGMMHGNDEEIIQKDSVAAERQTSKSHDEPIKDGRGFSRKNGGRGAASSSSSSGSSSSSPLSSSSSKSTLKSSPLSLKEQKHGSRERRKNPSSSKSQRGKESDSEILSLSIVVSNHSDEHSDDTESDGSSAGKTGSGTCHGKCCSIM